MSSTMTARRCAYALPILAMAGGAIAGMPTADANNKRPVQQPIEVRQIMQSA